MITEEIAGRLVSRSRWTDPGTWWINEMGNNVETKRSEWWMYKCVQSNTKLEEWELEGTLTAAAAAHTHTHHNHRCCLLAKTDNSMRLVMNELVNGGVISSLTTTCCPLMYVRLSAAECDALDGRAHSIHLPPSLFLYFWTFWRENSICGELKRKVAFCSPCDFRQERRWQWQAGRRQATIGRSLTAKMINANARNAAEWMNAKMPICLSRQIATFFLVFSALVGVRFLHATTCC